MALFKENKQFFKYEFEKNIQKFDQKTTFLLDTKIVYYRYFVILFLLTSIIIFSYIFNEKLKLVELSLLFINFLILNLFVHLLNLNKINFADWHRTVFVFFEISLISLLGYFQTISSSYISKTSINFIYFMYPIMIGFSAINGKIRLINFAIFVAIVEIFFIAYLTGQETESTVVYSMFSIFFGLVIQLVAITFKYLIRARTQFLYDIEKKQLEKGNEMLRREIDFRIQSEQQLENARAELFLQKTALENLQHAIDRHAIILTFDRKAIVHFVNRQFLELTEKPEDYWIGRSILIIRSRFYDKKFYVNVWKRVLNGKIWQGELQLEYGNNIFWVDATIAPIFSTNNKPERFICISNLINERKRFEEELIVSLNKEKELAAFKNRLISMISHEFRTPLTSVLLSTETLTRFSHKITDETKDKLLNNINESCKRMDALIDDALVMNKSDSGNMRFLPERVNLKTFCLSLTDEINMIAQKKVQVQFQYLLELENFLIDSNLLRYSISNLLNNAVKYSDKGKDILFAVYSEEGNIVFKVQDFGIGIPNEDKPKIFEPFYRAKNVDTLSGTGLGMAIAQKSAIIHGGNLSFESVDKEGTIFYLRIPLVKAETP